MELEKDLERYLVKRVKDAGGRAYKFVSPSNRGVSDRIVCLPGRTIFVELKRTGGALSPLQKLFAADMEALGQKYVCLWSKQEIDKWLSETIKKTQ